MYQQVNDVPKFMTIKEVAKTGLLPEHALRLMLKQNKIPHIMCGSKCMVNYTLLVERLNEDSKKAVTA